MVIDYKYTAEIGARWDADALRALFAGARSVVMVAHMNADGDAVGSLTGFHSLLASHTTARLAMLLPDGCPDDYRWLPHTDLILSGQDHPDECRQAIAAADLIVCLDLADLGRTGRLADLLRAADCTRLLIDHHEHSPLKIQNSEFNLEVVDPDISSACELVYWLGRDLWGLDAFGPDAATSLYTGLCTDTGTFAYSNRHASLYLAAAHLSQCGIDPMDLNRRIRNTFTPERLRFFGHAMSHLLEIHPEQSIALMTIRECDMQAYGVASPDLTGLVNEVMRLRDTDCAILLREEGDKVRLSLRSKTRYDVNRMARDLFDGGGHERAAGATSRLSLADTLAKVKRHLGLLSAILCLFLAASCRDVPTLDLQPAADNSLKENLIDANRTIARSEETQIDAYVSRRGWQMQRLATGPRVMVVQPGSGPKVEYEDTVGITYSVEALGGQRVYSNVTDTVVVGRLQPTRGIDAALRTLRRGDRARIILPSEQAYGVLGDGHRITTRMVLIYDLTVNQ